MKEMVRCDACVATFARRGLKRFCSKFCADVFHGHRVIGPQGCVITCIVCGERKAVQMVMAKACHGCLPEWERRRVRAWGVANPEMVRAGERRRAAKPERKAYHREFYLRKRALKIAPLWTAAAAEVSRTWIALPPAPEVKALPEHASVTCVGGPSAALVCQTTRRFVAGYCVERGEAFVSPYRGDRFCSRACRKRNERRKDRARRRSRQRDGERIDLAVVAVRDGWRCHICKRKVTRKTWSLDHLIPLSPPYNGPHRYENVALAHHRCNSLRGARGAAQLRLAA